MKNRAASIKLGVHILSILMLWNAIAESATIYVPDNYATIQQAVSTTSAGDLVVVRGDIHIVTGTLTIPEKVILNIEPGAILKFYDKYSRLVVEGTVSAIGGEALSEKIVFTSYLDDEFGGDTNGDGATTTPSHGNWDQVYFGPTSEDSELNNVVVRYGGGGYGTPCRAEMAAIRVEDCSIIIRQSTIEHNQHTGLSLINSSSTIDAVDLIDNPPCTAAYEYGGIGLGIIGGNPGVQNCLFRQNKYGLYIKAGQTPAAPLVESNIFEENEMPVFVYDSIPYFSNNQAVNNEINGIVIGGSGHSVPADASWQADLPYVVQSGVTVAEGVTLNLEPGVVVKPYNRYGGIVVNGTLKAEHVVFTSLKDDANGGDTNNDNSATSPAPGDWDKIYFSPTSVDSELNNAVVQYGGGGFGTPCSPDMSGITVDQSSIILTDSIIEHNQYKGLTLTDSSSIIDGVDFIDNPPCEAAYSYGGSAFWINGGSPVIKNCTITKHRIGAQVWDLSGGGIFLNDFRENDRDVLSQNSTGYWHSPEELTYIYAGDSYTNHLGNYWDNYLGSDTNGDGVGEEPYIFTYGGQDIYPLTSSAANYDVGEQSPSLSGVVFDDKNHNKIYDPGEEVAGALISHGEEPPVTSQSNGRYAIFGLQGSDVWLNIEFDDHHYWAYTPIGSIIEVDMMTDNYALQMVDDCRADVACAAGIAGLIPFVGVGADIYSLALSLCSTQERFEGGDLVGGLVGILKLTIESLDTFKRAGVLVLTSGTSEFIPPDLKDLAKTSVMCAESKLYETLDNECGGYTKCILEKFKWIEEEVVAIFTGSPVDIRVMDSEGNVMELDVNGYTVNGLTSPGWIFKGPDHRESALIFDADDYYTVQITGTPEAGSSSTFCLELMRQTSNGSQEVLSYTNVPISAEGYAVAQIAEEVHPVLDVDTDGDGTIDLDLLPDDLAVQITSRLPQSKNIIAGRIVPIKFSARRPERVEAAMPFIHDETLEVRIYDTTDPHIVMQKSTYGDKNTDYRIDDVDELYITNFTTKEEVAEYIVEIWRPEVPFMVGSFAFQTIASNRPPEVSAPEAVAFSLFEVGEIIEELGPESFADEGSATELAYMIDDVFTMLDEGMYYEALVILRDDVMTRTDGCATIGMPDEDDWITSFEGQEAVYPLVLETIELLESLM